METGRLADRPAVSTPTRAARGFSTIELLVVLGIMAVLLIVGFPNLVRWSDKMRLDGAARGAAMHASLARLKAASHNFSYTLAFVPDGGSWQGVGAPIQGTPNAALVIEGTEGGVDLNGNGIIEEEDPSEDVRLVYRFPEKVTLAVPPANLPSVTVAFDPTVNSEVEFQSTGLADLDTASAGVFVLYMTNDHDDFAAISIWHSGRIRVHRWNQNRNAWES